MLVKQKQFAPPNILQIGYPELNEAFLNGSTAMVVQWNDLAFKVGDAKMSKVVGKGGYAAVPSRTYMPYSRVMAVSAFSKNPEDAYKVAAHMQMPDVDGLTATGLIRAREKADGGHLPIVAMTAHAMTGDRERCLSAGMDGYLAKPIDPVQMIEEIDRVLAS